jgi:protein-tyrosine-phosphatase/predicted ATP-grasp superfamily ATP-dependent carboligase
VISMGGALILDGHSRAAVETVQALGRSGIKVIVSAEKRDAIAFRSRYPINKLIQPRAIPSQKLMHWLEDLNARHGLDLIIPCTENSLQAFLEVPEENPLRRIAVLPPSRSLRTTLDKNLTGRYALQLGIPVPSTRLVERIADIGETPRFPVVLKTARSKLAEGNELKTFEPAIVRDEQAWRSVLIDWVPRMAVLEQEYIQGWGVGIEMLYREGKLAWYFAHERLHEWPLTGGASTYRRSIEPPEGMLEASRRLLDSLEWHGVAMVEFKYRPNGSFTLMEVNPRLWGSLALSIDSGVNFPLGLWQIATGQALAPQPSFRRAVRTRHLASDLQWCKANLLADRNDRLLLTRSRFRSLAELGLPFLGRESWDHFDLRDPGPVFHEFRQLIDIMGRAVRRRWRALSFILRRRRLIERAISLGSTAGTLKRPSLLFVCEANICRSAFAAVVAAHRLPGFQIESAGFDSRAGRQTPPNVSEQARRMGFEMSQCASKPLTDEHVRGADLIFVMNLAQFERLTQQFPGSLGRVLPLGLFATQRTVEIEDPNHKDAATTNRVMVQIASAIERLAIAFTSLADSARLPALHGNP